MGKIVKYCHSCDEGFAEKFGFCPNCGQTLSAFEMNPVPPVQPVKETNPAPARAEANEPVRPASIPVEAAPVAPPVIEEPKAPEPARAAPPEPRAVEPPRQAEPVRNETPKKAAAAASSYVVSKPMNADTPRKASLSAEHDAFASDGGFYVTVIEEKNGAQRNMLLLGSFAFMIVLSLGALVFNIFSKDLDLGAIGDDTMLASVIDDVPTVVDEVKQQKNNDKGGGGGGGGRNEQEEVTQGDLADQVKNPTRPPDAKVPRFDDFELKTPPPQTQGNQTFEKKFDRWGDPNGRFSNFSNGTGSGGGQGSGVGTGQGSGRGTGAGSGTGSGYGGGLGSGNGNGTGDGGGGVPPPPEKKVGVTQAIRIISKPRANYTDEARTAAAQGTVILRVTFLANGQIGSVSTVKGMPYGLTESAIAAAHRITFEPAKLNGAGQTVTKQIEYSFSIY